MHVGSIAEVHSPLTLTQKRLGSHHSNGPAPSQGKANHHVKHAFPTHQQRRTKEERKGKFVCHARVPSGPGLQGLPPGCEHASDPADGGRTTGSDGCPRTDGNQPVAVASCSSGIMQQWHHAALQHCIIASCTIASCIIASLQHCIIAALHHCTIASCHIKCNTTQHDMAEST